MQTSPRYYDLLDALPEVGCPVCRLVSRAQNRYLDSLLYEYVNKLPTNQAFRDGRGLCNLHMAQLQSMKGNALGIAILMHAALDEVIKIDEQIPDERGNGFSRLMRSASRSTRADALEPTGPCIACEHMTAAEISYMEVLNVHHDDHRIIDGLRNSPGGLCLPHTRLALRYVTPKSEFMAIQREHWQQLRAELVTFMDKYNLSKPLEDMGDEADSWRRAIRYLAGEPGIFTLRRSY